MTFRKWQGVFPAVTTKFKPDLRLDIAAMEKHFGWQVESGVDGLIVCGSLGENSVLDVGEKLEVLRVAVRVPAGGDPRVLPNAGGKAGGGACASAPPATDGRHGVTWLPRGRPV